MGKILSKIKEVDTSSFNEFQIKIWNMFVDLSSQLRDEEMSEQSRIEEGVWIDVILNLKGSDIVINFSIRKDLYNLNSNYFDINVYPEEAIEKIRILTSNLLHGRYSIDLGFNSKDKLVTTEMFFNEPSLVEYNKKQHIGLFSKEVQYEKTITGDNFFK